MVRFSSSIGLLQQRAMALQTLIQNSCMALAINLHYKKSFKLNVSHTAPIIMLVILSCFQYGAIFWPAFLGTCLLFWIMSLERTFPLKSIDKYDTIYFVANFSSVFLFKNQSVDLTLNYAAGFIAHILQMIRNPEVLKTILRPFRLTLGPCGIFLIMSCAWKVAFYSSGVPMILRVLAMTQFSSSALGGILFRPDNMELLSVFTTRVPKPGQRKLIHVLANTYSIFITIVFFCYF